MWVAKIQIFLGVSLVFLIFLGVNSSCWVQASLGSSLTSFFLFLFFHFFVKNDSQYQIKLIKDSGSFDVLSFYYLNIFGLLEKENI